MEGEDPVLGSARPPDESLWIYLLGLRRKEVGHRSFQSLEAPRQTPFTPNCWGPEFYGDSTSFCALKKRFGKSLWSESGTLGRSEPWDSLH